MNDYKLVSWRENEEFTHDIYFNDTQIYNRIDNKKIKSLLPKLNYGNILKAYVKLNERQLAKRKDLIVIAVELELEK